MENACSSIDLTTRQSDVKGGIRNGVDCTAAYPGERCRHHCPSEPSTPLRGAPKNVLVEWGVECSSTKQGPVTSNVLPIADRTERISTAKIPSSYHDTLRTVVYCNRPIHRANRALAVYILPHAIVQWLECIGKN